MSQNSKNSKRGTRKTKMNEMKQFNRIVNPLRTLCTQIEVCQRGKLDIYWHGICEHAEILFQIPKPEKSTIQGFLKIDHSGSTPRIVLEQKKIQQKSYPQQELNPMTLVSLLSVTFLERLRL